MPKRWPSTWSRSASSRFQAGKLLQGVTKGMVLGAYHLLSPIGKGGIGAIFLARDTRNQTLAAVKVLPPNARKPRSECSSASAARWKFAKRWTIRT